MLPTRIYKKLKYKEKINIREQKKYHINTNQKKAGVATYQFNFRAKNPGIKEGHFIKT